MDDNLAIFLVITIAIVAAVILKLATSWIRAKHGAQVSAADHGVSLIEEQNALLRGQVARLEERLHVLERIAVDPAERTAREIERLR